jgi:nitrogen-specific signal transduction histidine kinase
VIEFDSEPRRTVFNVMLPVYTDSSRPVRIPAEDMSSHE